MLDALLLVDVLVGVALVATIAVAARRPPVARSRGLRTAGWVLVAVPLPLAVALHLLLPLPRALDQAAFLIGVLGFAAGALLVLTSDEDEGLRESPDDPEPPAWWPAFEREFREYERRSSRPRVRV